MIGHQPVFGRKNPTVETRLLGSAQKAGIARHQRELDDDIDEFTFMTMNKLLRQHSTYIIVGVSLLVAAIVIPLRFLT